ncbi:hypothetical protein U9R62_05170 [Cylindrospermopsis raciborskii DSH]|uniref:hypothetical protein n=1 Tax=Cylindrospermopsis raciborskii TaxID=77022 RepID=UPI002ED7A010
MLPSLLGGKISVDGLCWLLAKSGGDTIWAYGRNEFINNIKYDLELIGNSYSFSLPDKRDLKCRAEVWKNLIDGWKGIQNRDYKCGNYRALAQLFQQLKEHDLAGYFYQVSDGFVKKDLKDLFDEISKKENQYNLAGYSHQASDRTTSFTYDHNSRSPMVVFGLRIKPRLNLVDHIRLFINEVIQSLIIFKEHDMKIPEVMIVSLVFFVSGLSLGNIFPINLNEQTTVSQSKQSTNPPEEVDLENVDSDWNKTTKAFEKIISDLSKNMNMKNTPRIIKDLYPNSPPHIIALMSVPKEGKLKLLKQELVFSLILKEMNITQYQKFSYAKLGNITDEQKIKIYQAIKNFQESNKSKLVVGYFDLKNPKDTSLNKLKERVRQKI